MAGLHRTSEQKRALIERYDELRATGMTISGAENEIDVYADQIRDWREKLATPAKVGRPAKKPYVETVQTHSEPAKPTKVACIIGTPQEISDVLRGLT